MEVTESTEFQTVPSDSPEVEKVVGSDDDYDKAMVIGEPPDPEDLKDYEPPNEPIKEPPEEYSESKFSSSSSEEEEDIEQEVIEEIDYEEAEKELPEDITV